MWARLQHAVRAAVPLAGEGRAPRQRLRFAAACDERAFVKGLEPRIAAWTVVYHGALGAMQAAALVAAGARDWEDPCDACLSSWAGAARAQAVSRRPRDRPPEGRSIF